MARRFTRTARMTERGRYGADVVRTERIAGVPKGLPGCSASRVRTMTNG
jgi:hypothetical protein